MRRTRVVASALVVPTIAAVLSSGCGSNLSPHAIVAPTPGADPGATASGDSPTIRTVDVVRSGHDLVVRLTLDATDLAATSTLTGLGSGRDGWTFQLGFDTDHDRRTGDPSGAEVAAVVGADGAAAMLVWTGGAWQLAGSSPLEQRAGSIAFRLDATRFASALGTAQISAESYLVTRAGDGGSDVAALSRRILGVERDPVPAVRRIRTEVRDGALVVRGQLAPGAHGDVYDPTRAGGWSLQLFLDTGQDGVGYWQGYDYIVRGEIGRASCRERV